MGSKGFMPLSWTNDPAYLRQPPGHHLHRPRPNMAEVAPVDIRTAAPELAHSRCPSPRFFPNPNTPLFQCPGVVSPVGWLLRFSTSGPRWWRKWAAVINRMRTPGHVRRTPEETGSLRVPGRRRHSWIKRLYSLCWETWSRFWTHRHAVSAVLHIESLKLIL